MVWYALAAIHFALTLLAVANGHPPYDAMQLGMLFLIAAKVDK